MRRTSQQTRLAASPWAPRIVWCHSATLCGSVHRGRPTEDDARALVRALELSMHPALAAGFDVLLDSSPISFRLPRLRRRRRVRDGTPVRVGAPHPSPGGGAAVGRSASRSRAWCRRSAARPSRSASSPRAWRRFGWLARPELGEVLREVDERVDGARGQSPLVRRLRDALERQLDGASLEGAAHTLGTTSRRCSASSCAPAPASAPS